MCVLHGRPTDMDGATIGNVRTIFEALESAGEGVQESVKVRMPKQFASFSSLILQPVDVASLSRLENR